jgi:NAD(P)-dependent dehydrogenase (short-subunit alcohol dehydrogenase family)
MRVGGKKAVVTGGAGGLGAAVARMLARHGARVALTDIDLERAKQIAAEIDAECGAGTARAFRHDVRDERQWVDVLGQASAAMEGLSVLVNNAGVVVTGTVESLSFEDWKRVSEVNLDSVFLGCKHALGIMRLHQPGSIINISSISGLIASANFAAYNATKAAVWMLTKSVALHCAREGLDIRCNSIHPAYVRTAMLDGLSAGAGGDKAALFAKLARQIPLRRLGEPQDVAYAALYLASDESRFMTAAELKLDGGISAM